MRIFIPGDESPLQLDSLILDLNGTLAVRGKVVDGVKERIDEIRRRDLLKMFLFTGDTQGNGARIAAELGLDIRITKNADEKRDEALKLGADTCATIGNGRIDAKLFQAVRLRIATLQAEGVHTETLRHADVVIPTITDALDLFLDEKIMIATLRH